MQHAQKEKIKNREKRIRLIGRDKLYSRSPEEIVIDEEERRPLRNTIDSVIDSFTQRQERAFSLYEQGLKKVDIAKEMGTSRYVVTREIKEAEQELKRRLVEEGYNEF